VKTKQNLRFGQYGMGLLFNDGSGGTTRQDEQQQEVQLFVDSVGMRPHGGGISTCLELQGIL
jgi:hypothetical protein